MTAGLGFLCAKGRPEAIDSSEGGRRRFVVQLTALCQIRLLAEVVSLKESRRPFTRVGCENRRIDQNEASVIKEISTRSDNFVSNTKNGVLPMRTDPQMPVRHEKPGAVFFRLDRKFLPDKLDDSHVSHIQLKTTQRPRI